MIVYFYEMEVIGFDIICQLSSVFAMKERNSALCSVFNCHFTVLLFEYFSNRVMGSC
jgi:hypothetical protein